MEQLSIYDMLDGEKTADDEPDIPVHLLFRPNAHRRCRVCRRRLWPVASTGRLLCLSVACTGEKR
jgi:hypothetical protein